MKIKNYLSKNFLFLSLFFLILLLGFIIRIWDLGKNPAGFFCDEASIGYNAYSIMNSGKDEWGSKLPILFKSVGDYKNSIFIYSAIPFVAIFGLTEFSIRLVSVVYGLLGIIAVYLLTNKLFNNKIALMTAFIMTILPWHIHFSRVGFELISSVFWVTFTIYLFVKSMENFNYYSIFIVSTIISLFTYKPVFIYLIPLLLLTFVIYRNNTNLRSHIREFLIFSLIGSVIVLILVYPFLKDGAFFVRWNQVKIPNITLRQIRTAYLNHFSLTFLFAKGEVGFPGSYILRQSIFGIGELYWFQLPLIIIGLLTIFYRDKYKIGRQIFFILLLTYPLSSVFTTVIPSATHSIIGVVPLSVFTALGFYFLMSFIHRKSKVLFISTIVIFIIIVIISFAYFINCWQKYPTVSAGYWGWQDGFEQIHDYFRTKKKDYDELIITHRFNQGETLLKFYNVENPCLKCRIMNNPIVINTLKNQLFALRTDDIKEAKRLYPHLRFIQYFAIFIPNREKEVSIGVFK